ncbi:LptF/LptG family permease [Acetobacter sp.]|uniref:LptF/LptG family permease n=1 Tax=Acetobacter sp. TaxID=440 RepID=UPI0025BBF146|nr:LptF/LptG family permease [Acetobacter sp.]MCH4092005.1 LptF/LptG family permease [Acetobacter sp.]MCI1300741.1 LptF/LptG family permease [Acetobacter sp.]MCI1317507.1 LptF/LptG family permease [Acetobacter sp.]
MFLAPFGSYTRYLLRTYLWQVGSILAILWLVALTIDILPQIGLLLDGAPAHPVRVILWFCVLRTPWLLVPLIPFATFLGVLTAEYLQTRSGVRILIWNSGRSPMGCLMPALLLGLLLGSVDTVLDAWVGPVSMAIQARDRLGRDGQRLDRSRASDFQWIALPEGLLRTRVFQADGIVHLKDLSFFHFKGPEKLVELVHAKEARQIEESSFWRVSDGMLWGGGVDDPRMTESILFGGPSTGFLKHDLQLSVDTIWLSVIGMEPQYVPFRIVRTLADRPSRGYDPAVYRTREQAVFADAMFVVMMAVAASVFSTVLLTGSGMLTNVTKILLVGYAVHSIGRACILFGENGLLPAALAAWSVPVMLFCGVTVFLKCQKGRQG